MHARAPACPTGKSKTGPWQCDAVRMQLPSRTHLHASPPHPCGLPASYLSCHSSLRPPASSSSVTVPLTACCPGCAPLPRPQARTLALSTLLTGLFGVAGFYALKQRGFFVTDRAELPNATEAARLLRNPRVRERRPCGKGFAMGYPHNIAAHIWGPCARAGWGRVLGTGRGVHARGAHDSRGQGVEGAGRRDMRHRTAFRCVGSALQQELAPVCGAYTAWLVACCTRARGPSQREGYQLPR